MRTLKITSLIFLITLSGCVSSPKTQPQEKTETISTQPFPNGTPIAIIFEKGEEFYHPLIVFWLEDDKGQFIETLYASQSIATGTFMYGVAVGKKWKKGERRKPAALPYWGHRRGIKATDGLFLPTPRDPLPDAITGATPINNFTINTKVKADTEYVKIFMEINQTWDWNHYWHNNLYPDDDDYKTSCQPALVYMARVNLTENGSIHEMVPIGHSHPSGKTGELFPDISNHTTALKIVKSITVKVATLD
ncbi:MAG TPA: hypothetical protein DG754_12705 [Bacteroidales bacterium]|nr:hypothetical protein [Bacteroidales bacterium]